MLDEQRSAATIDEARAMQIGCEPFADTAEVDRHVAWNAGPASRRRRSSMRANPGAATGSRDALGARSESDQLERRS